MHVQNGVSCVALLLRSAHRRDVVAAERDVRRHLLPGIDEDHVLGPAQTGRFSAANPDETSSHSVIGTPVL